jgi:hypothetical protein
MAGELGSKLGGNRSKVSLVHKPNGKLGAVRISYRSDSGRHEIEINKAHSNIGVGKSGKVPMLTSHRDNHKIVYDFGLYKNMIKGGGTYYTSVDDEGIEMTPSIKSLIARSEIVSEMLSHAARFASDGTSELSSSAAKEFTLILSGAAKSEEAFASELNNILNIELSGSGFDLRSRLERSKKSFAALKKL